MSGDTVSGKVGETVQVTAGITDLGPADPPDNEQGQPLVLFDVQFLGVTVVTMPDRCEKSGLLTGSDNYPDMSGVEFSRITEYECRPAPRKDDPVQVTFAVRLDEPGQHRTGVGYFLTATGTTTGVREFNDPNADNNVAWITVDAVGDQASDATGTGGPSAAASPATGGLPATPGSHMALVRRSGSARLAAGLLAVLAVAAAAVVVLGQRRRGWPRIRVALLRRQTSHPPPSTTMGSGSANSATPPADPPD